MHDDARPHQLSWSSERTIRVSLGDEIGDESHARVRAAMESLRQAVVPSLVDVTPAYTTLLLTFDPRSLDPDAAESAVQAALERTSHALPAPARRIVIPVCYEADCAPDLMEVAAMHRVEASEVVRLHSSAVYTVQFIGFSPGFAYLAGLPRRLETPRLERPRTRVPAGSIGLAGMQTGVYPRSTPGGWRIIGRTPLRMFDAARAEASTLALGDCVRFQPITRAEFADLSSEHA